MADKTKVALYLPYEFENVFAELSDEEVGKMIRAIMVYDRTGEEPNFDGVLRFAWRTHIEPKMRIIKDNYERKCKQNKENIKKRWNRGGDENNTKNTNVYERNFKDTNVNDIDIDIDIDKDIDKEIIIKKNTNDTNEYERIKKPFSDDGMEVIKLYEERFGMVSTYKATQLDDLVKDFGKDVVAYAVRQANISSASAITYIRNVAMNEKRRRENGTGNTARVSETNPDEPMYGQGIVV